MTVFDRVLCATLEIASCVSSGIIISFNRIALHETTLHIAHYYKL